MVALYDHFDALRRVDHFARVVAVLAWLADAGQLPPLPDWVKPVKAAVPAELYIKDVFPEARP